MVKVTQTFYESDFAVITGDSQTEVLYITWSGPILLETAKAGLQEALKVIRFTKSEKLISDSSQVDNSWAASNAWIVNYWQPLAVKAGLRKVAFVTSPHLLTRLSMENLQSKLMRQRNTSTEYIQVFYSLEEAEIWMEETKDDR
ncbi:MAG: hypothetical protein ACFB0B_04920 [Thermonemataceae bacterium]